MVRQTIAEGAARLIAQRGPMSARELGQALVADGLTNARQPARAVSAALKRDDRFARLRDERWVNVEALLANATLTHRLTDVEAEDGRIFFHPDLSALAPLVYGGRLLTTSGTLGLPVRLVMEDEPTGRPGIFRPSLVGPRGWLDSARPGDLLAFRARRGRLDIERIPEPGPESRLAARRLSARARSRLEAIDTPFVAPATSVATLVIEALAETPDLLTRPIAPLGEALTADGLEVHDDLVGYPGTDWSGWDELFADVLGDDEDEGAAALRELYGLDDRAIEGIRLFFGAFEVCQQSGTLPEGSIASNLAAMLNLPGIAEVVSLEAWRTAEFETFIAELNRAAPRLEAAGARYVLACCAEARGDVLAAESRLNDALASDPTFPPALLDAAWYAEDRGDAQRALGYLGRAQVDPDDPQRRRLEALVRPVAARVGRNDPCPCGSGQKFKRCCAGKPAGRPAGMRAAWLHAKALLWARRPAQRMAFRDVAVALVGADDEEGWVGAALDDDLVEDIALFDRGLFERFLEARGVLLPAEELALGRSWSKTRRSLYEVLAAKPGIGLTLRDLRTDEIVEVTDRAASGALERLDLVYTRLVPGVDGPVIVCAPLLVPRRLRVSLLGLLGSDADGLTIARWFRDAAGPPERIVGRIGRGRGDHPGT